MAASIRYDDVATGDALPSAEYRVVRKDLVMYAGASGDFNDIHWDPSFARAVGLPDTIATGMHTMGRIGSYLADWCGDAGAIVRFKNRFSGMVVVPDDGASVTIEATIAEKLSDNLVAVAFEATAAGASVSKGTAYITLA